MINDKRKYWAWLLICAILWVAVSLRYYAHREGMSPAKMAATINRDLKEREEGLTRFLAQRELIAHIFLDSITESEAKQLIALPFYFYAYEQDSLVYWNNNYVIGSLVDSMVGKTILRKNDNGIFVKQTIRIALQGRARYIVAMIPVLITYPIENNYLRSHFVASDMLPVKSRISATKSTDGNDYKLTLKDGSAIGYIAFGESEQRKQLPDGWTIALLLAAIVASAWFLELLALGYKGKWWASVAFLTLCVIVVKVYLVVFGLPMELEGLRIFAPDLYGASKYLHSLGDLYIDIVLILWLLSFFLRHVSYKHFFSRHTSLFNSVVPVVAILLVLAGTMSLYLWIAKSLIIDSKISFDVTHFYSIDVFTVFGLLAILLVTGLTCVVTYLCNLFLSKLLRSRWLKPLVLVLGGAVLLLTMGRAGDQLYWCSLIALVSLLMLLDLPRLAIVPNLFAPQMILWSIIVCGLCTWEINHFNASKEHDARKLFVESRLTPYRDSQMESSFNKKAKRIERDERFQNFLKDPNFPERKKIDKYIDSNYLAGISMKYQVKVYLFDPQGNTLFNGDTTSLNSLIKEKEESIHTNSDYLFYKESILDRHYYLSYIPIYDDSTRAVPIGFVIIDLDRKKSVNETVYPELLQPSSDKQFAQEDEYAYAVYSNGKLITQTNDYPFPVELKNDTLETGHFAFVDQGGVTALIYNVAEKRTAMVIHYHSQVIETVTLFSYLFGIQLMISILFFMIRLVQYSLRPDWQKNKFFRFTLRKRVHLSMLMVVMISFVIIGAVTIKFFSSEYRNTNDKKLRSSMLLAKQFIQEHLAQEHAFTTDLLFDNVSQSAAFKSYISSVANNEKIDINVYDDRGTLFVSSQDEIYDKGLISRKIRPDAFYELNNQGKSIVIQNEMVAGLSYKSAYQPLRDEHGVTLGYINVPFFSSEKDLKFQISNILVTLINIYAFIFLVSGLITVIFTRWITRTFDVVIKQFDKLNLEKNERLVWPYDDEIGKLVSEYNKMAKKVEENAVKLAQTEREMAWREMARQVAHEIKNPLTPMKLNIQYLLQASNRDTPNMKQLIERVTASIIEQIDNLSYIASEFSNFAKLPEAKPETLELGQLLNKAAELYVNESNTELTYENRAGLAHVVSDKSQLLRVVTNLLENARQAINDKPKGTIHVILETEGEMAIISIVDNGTGIHDDVARRIFEPYFTTRSSGTGLGLAMTKKIIEFWKGEISFDTKVGEGTTFYIKLPLVG